MPEEKTFTESEAHRHFAVLYHKKTWDLLDKKGRTREENEMMLDYAYTSLAHWRVAGTAIHHQRGVWMLSRVHAVLGNGPLALQYAERCLELFRANETVMEDFDSAFTYEALARAHAINGNQVEAKKFIDIAQKAGDSIKEKEDRDTFFCEFNGGNWNEMK